jgi:hypothetical protein
MPIECLAVVAYICLNQSANIALLSDGGFTSTKINIDNVEIVSAASLDNLTPPNLSVMTSECSDGACFHYTRYCSAHEQNYKCEFYYSIGTERLLRKISFSGKQDSIAAVMQKVSFYPMVGKAVLFSRLNFDNGRKEAPSCLRRNGCKEWSE